MLSNEVDDSETSLLLSSPKRSLSHSLKCLLLRHFCHLSKSAIVIVFVSFVVSVSYTFLLHSAIDIGYVRRHKALFVLCIYASLAVATLFYPVSGFLADVYCGRYKIISAGVGLIFGAYCLSSIIAVLTLIFHRDMWHTLPNSPIDGVHLFAVVVSSIGVFMFVLGVAGYQANFVQFGLDQLLEAPSVSLALFIHLIVWAFSLGTFAVQVLNAFFICKYPSNASSSLQCWFVLIMSAFVFFALLCLNCCTFYTEPGHHNPYKMVVKVLNFARKHKYPLQRSAFTYCDDEEPSRIDFAKERYGGPFTTEQVEDVKVLLRIILVFVTLGPTFVLDISSSSFIFLIFGIHVVEDQSSVFNRSCTIEFVLLDKGSIIEVVTILFLPVYMWIVFTGRCAPRILPRLIFAVVVYLLAVASMFSIDLLGHVIAAKDSRPGDVSKCMFQEIRGVPLLGIHWAVLLVPATLLGIGPPLITATVFEFISAQSPSSMKGLLVGVFFTIKAFFNIVGGAALIPFAYKPLWDSRSMREHPPVTNCGFGYFSFTCVVALIGLILLSVAIKKYKQRERDDRPYDHRFVVDVYSRYIEQALQSNVN